MNSHLDMKSERNMPDVKNIKTRKCRISSIMNKYSMLINKN